MIHIHEKELQVTTDKGNISVIASLEYEYNTNRKFRTKKIQATQLPEICAKDVKWSCVCRCVITELGCLLTINKGIL